MRKIIQLCAINAGPHALITALCDDGSTWLLMPTKSPAAFDAMDDPGKWLRLADIPQEAVN